MSRFRALRTYYIGLRTTMLALTLSFENELSDWDYNELKSIWSAFTSSTSSFTFRTFELFSNSFYSDSSALDSISASSSDSTGEGGSLEIYGDNYIFWNLFFILLDSAWAKISFIPSCMVSAYFFIPLIIFLPSSIYLTSLVTVLSCSINIDINYN